MEQLIGREKEVAQLKSLSNKDKSSFVAVYGRRRVGKTFLIRNAFPEFDFILTGLANVNTPTQLANFDIALEKFAPTHTGRPTGSWLEAFSKLEKLLSGKSHKKKIVFLDELPWLDTPKSGFLPALEHFWNSWASTRDDIILVVCGSAASWIVNKLLNSKGGLHNRVTERISLVPFSLKECETYFKNRSAVFDRYQVVLLYMVMGGIPFYLEQVDPQESAAQNINRLCFSSDGILRTEFSNLYHSLFQKAEKHILIIETLSRKAKGLSREELLQHSKLADGGSVTRLLKELEESYFIRHYYPFGKKINKGLYQLTDFYSLFYLRWIRGNEDGDENAWLNQLNSPRQYTWAGYAFEQVCLAHVRQIKQALGIAGVSAATSSWIGRGNSERAQVDLVIDRADHIINMCEMKFSTGQFSITKSYAEELKRKLRIFQEQSGTRKSVALTLITSYGLIKNQYSTSLVQKELTMDDLF